MGKDGKILTGEWVGLEIQSMIPQSCLYASGRGLE